MCRNIRPRSRPGTPPRVQIPEIRQTDPLHQRIHRAHGIFRQAHEPPWGRLLQHQLAAGVADQQNVAVGREQRHGALIVVHAAIHERDADVLSSNWALSCSGAKTPGTQAEAATARPSSIFQPAATL